MRQALVLVLVLGAVAAVASPSGNRWFISNCSTTCQLSGGFPNANRVCVNDGGTGVCLPEVRFAASIDNAGGMTLPGTQQISYAFILSSMRAQFEKWSVPNTVCAPAIGFAFESPNFTTPSGPLAVNATDGTNNVIWFSSPNWRYSSATLGLTTVSFYPGGELGDSDMEMNAGTVTWAQGATIPSGDYDWESVVTHEVGHFIGFEHTLNSVAVMFANLGAGEIKRTLQDPDRQDLCTVYPGTPGSQGSPCATTACLSGLVCEGPLGSSARFCTRDCTQPNDQCPAGFTCQTSSSGSACLPRVGATDMCKFCSSGQACTTGVCVTDGMGRNWCSMTCNPTVSGQCGPGFTCNQTPAGNYCFPQGGVCQNQCTTQTVGTSCAPGYDCLQGTCTPTGRTGDRCEVSEICANCNACATDETNSQIAFCRACCNGAGPLCTSCSTTTCAPVGGATTMCLSIPGRQEQLCYPSGGAATCQMCNAVSPCAGGAMCVGGFCRSACNPTNPGGCPACLPTVNGGICACSAQEISDANEPCSAAGTMLAICRNGLACISNFCRQRCLISDPTSCPTGSTCQLAENQQVCIPSTVGMQCAQCGPGNSCEAGLRCFGSRCYRQCTVTLPNQCATCVQVEPDPPQGSGAGVCGCPDQVVGPGASCLLPNIATCQSGTRCISGTCQSRCDPSNAQTCPAGHLCTALGSEFYCTVDTSGEGGGTAGGGTTARSGGRAGGGTTAGGSAGGGTINNMGCACQSVSAELWLLAPLLLGFARRRRA